MSVQRLLRPYDLRLGFSVQGVVHNVFCTVRIGMVTSLACWSALGGHAATKVMCIFVRVLSALVSCDRESYRGGGGRGVVLGTISTETSCLKCEVGAIFLANVRAATDSAHSFMFRM